MTDREKLIHLIESAACPGPEEFGACSDRRDGVCTETRKLSVCTIGCIADHLLANGVMVMPCKEGTTIFKIHYQLGGNHKITETQFSLTYCHPSDFGKWFFLTREEAEKAAKKMV